MEYNSSCVSAPRLRTSGKRILNALSGKGSVFLLVCSRSILDMRQKKKNRKLVFSKTLAGVLAALLLMGLLFGCGFWGSTDKEAEKLPQIVVGSDVYPPFNYEDADGTPTGIDVELAREAFRRMGYEPKFMTIVWEEKNELLEQGTIDCIWGSFSIDGRENQYRWTEPYMYSRQVVAVRENSPIYTLQDLEGKRVAVQSTTKPEGIFLSHTDPRIPQIRELFSLQNRELLYPYLSKGYADAIAAHETSIMQSMVEYNLHYRILEEPLLTVGLGVAFAKEDERSVCDELSQTFRDMREDGTMEKIIGKYLKNPESYLEVNGNEK